MRPILAAILLSSTVFAKQVHFEMKDAIQRDVVQFSSESTLEKVVGISSAISGWVDLDPKNLGEGIKGEFEVDLRTFDTGNSLRDAHFRETFLNTPEFPTSTLTIGRVLHLSKNTMVDQQPIIARVEGAFRVKGAVKSQPVLLKLVYFKQSEQTQNRMKGNLLKVSSTFDLDLGAFGVALPDALKFRLSRFVQVSVDVVGTDAALPALVPLTESETR